MTIRNRLTFLFTTLITIIVLGVALFVYGAYETNRKTDFFTQLRQEAETKANLLLDAKVAPAVLQLIYKNTRSTFFEEEVAIYDYNFNLLYHDASDIDIVKEDKTMIERIKKEKELQFTQGEKQVIGFLFNYQDKQYIITAVAYDKAGLDKLYTLRYILIIICCLSTFVIFFVGRFFSKKALQPVSEMVHEVEEITATNLYLRVNQGDGKDEIAELAITFNQMLDRLENSFNAQKQFVHNISHELRTPLAAIISELDLALTKERSSQEYKLAIQNVLQDAQKIARLATNLLDFAKASYDQTAIVFKNIRLDEVLLDAQIWLSKTNPAYKINIEFEQEIENEQFITILGNEYLLKVAFMNLLENACKFSDNQQVNVKIGTIDKLVKLQFIDTGIGISDTDLKQLFTPFFRGSNSIYADGNGIGLSLTHKIISLHKGTIAVQSQIQKGSTFIVKLPSIA